MAYFMSSEGTKKIYYEIIEPDGQKPKGVIQVIHGMCEYFGRYKEFCDFMTAHGYAVAGDDHLGRSRRTRAFSEKATAGGFWCAMKRE